MSRANTLARHLAGLSESKLIRMREAIVRELDHLEQQLAIVEAALAKKDNPPTNP